MRMSADPFILYEPSQLTSSIVFATPHSGRNYSQEFLDSTILDAHAIRASEDAFVDQLFQSVTAVGAPLLAALMPRAFVDLNRSCEELDPALIEEIRSTGLSARVTSGLGVVPRVVAVGRPIYNGKISLGEAQTRLQDVWHPYHQRLQSLLDATRTKFGYVVLIDCHSMPHEAVNPGLSSKTSPEVVVGDRFGAAADPKVTERVQAAFVRAGFRVSRNMPFAGAYISQHYGKPKRGQHVIQIEIDRSLYMDEASVKPLANFADFQIRLHKVIREIAEFEAGQGQIAAE